MATLSLRGDKERLDHIRQQLADGERLQAAGFGKMIANRARDADELKDDAATLRALVHVLADALIEVGDSHSRRGRPKAKDGNLEFAEHAMVQEYHHLLTASDLREGKELSAQTVARFVWYCTGADYDGPLSPEAKLESITQTIRAKPKAATVEAIRIADALLRECGLEQVERQQFPAAARKWAMRQTPSLQWTDAKWRAAVTAYRKRTGLAS